MSVNLVAFFCLAALICFPATECASGREGKSHSWRSKLGEPPLSQNYILPPDMWFDQELDHFNPQVIDTWKQRYQVNDTFYKPGNPIFLMIGGEGPASPKWLVEGAWISYAQKYGALCLQLEHRYYGKSHPTPDLSTANLRYLTSEQALEDLANFRVQMTAKMNLTGRWISFGGSYPGGLSAWFRLKYPHLVYGAIASSAPVFAIDNFKEYLSVVRASLATHSEKCVESVRIATGQVEYLMDVPAGRYALAKGFNSCQPINGSDANEISNFYSAVAGNFEGIVQYNKDNRDFEGAGTDVTIDTLCDIMTDTVKYEHPYAAYLAVNELMNKGECLDASYKDMIKSMTDITWESEAGEGGRQWTYQTCTEFGYYQTSDSTDQPFGSHFSLNFWVQQCQDIFGSSISKDVLREGIAFTNANYGGFNLKASRTVFPNGSIDPWHALGITKNISDSAPAIYINGTAHCANMYPSAVTDLPELTAARDTISRTIGQWLSQE